MRIYLNPLSPNCRKVEFVLHHLEVDAERVTIDLADQDARATLSEVNPNGMVPALQDGETTLWESNAIMPYLCSKVSETSLWPKSQARYDIMRWMNWQLAHLGPAVDVFTWENMLKGMFGQGDPDPAALEAGRPKFERFAKVLDDALADHKFLTGDTLTLADVAVGATLTYAEPAKLPMAGLDNVQRWRAALDEVPAWRASAPKM